MQATENISYIDTVANIRDTYKCFTEADMFKMRTAGYTQDFWSLEDGTADYVRNYLMKSKHY